MEVERGEEHLKSESDHQKDPEISKAMMPMKKLHNWKFSFPTLKFIKHTRQLLIFMLNYLGRRLIFSTYTTFSGQVWLHGHGMFDH